MSTLTAASAPTYAAASQPLPDPKWPLVTTVLAQGQYGKRNHAETTMGRYKHLIGPKLRARSRLAQLGEVVLAVQVLNRMIRSAKPVSVRR